MSQYITHTPQGSLHRDRYTTVRDERDAYQQLQDQFSGQMDMTSKMLEDSAMEKEKLSFEVAHVQREIASAKLALHQVLTRTTVIAVSAVSSISGNSYYVPLHSVSGEWRR